MKNVIFRGERLIDREKEIEFFKEWFSNKPKEILWVYGPKSCGKTTLIEYIIENELFDDFKLFKSKKYNVKYINFRGRAVYNYESFVNSMLINSEVAKKEWSIKLDLEFFVVNYDKLKEARNKEIDVFKLLEEEFEKSKKTNVFVIDEIQVLEDLYINGEKEILREFLNFCVRLTKELHLSHVVILSSNTVFINRIYNDAKLKVTSRFYKIDHLDYETTKEWLKEEKFSDKEIELIWDYLGGCIPLIQRMIRDKHEFNTLKEYLDRQKWLAYTEIVEILRIEEDKEVKKAFKFIAKEILKNGFYLIKDEEKESINRAINKFSEKEILFYEPLELKVKGNNRLYEKGMELLIES